MLAQGSGYTAEKWFARFLPHSPILSLVRCSECCVPVSSRACSWKTRVLVGKKTGKTPWRKHVEGVASPLLGNHLQAQKTRCSDVPSFHSQVEAQRQGGFQREAFCAVFAVLNNNGPRIPEKTTGHASDLTHKGPRAALTVATLPRIIPRQALPTV